MARGHISDSSEYDLDPAIPGSPVVRRTWRNGLRLAETVGYYADGARQARSQPFDCRHQSSTDSDGAFLAESHVVRRGAARIGMAQEIDGANAARSAEARDDRPSNLRND